MAINPFIKQFEFEHWSNGTILDALRKLTEPSDRGLFLFSHLLSSHSMWLSRVTKTEMRCTLFQERTLVACEALMHENLEGWRAYLADKTQAQLGETIEFMGAWEQPPQKRRMTIEDALMHIISHSAYHRGQIIVHIKGKVEELPLSTYIIYASEVLEG
jgi:uncharacterized damage-inducible protein DinB